MGPHPAVAAVRLAVRRGLAGLDPGHLVLAACSGGADSLALAAALAFEGPRLGLRAGGITVDHGLQPGSAAQASRVAAILARLGLEPVLAIRAAVARPGAAGPAYPGPEAAARAARYRALDQAGAAAGAAAILLGHTLDDQAETVLLGLARGSGARSLAGMAPRSTSNHGTSNHGTSNHGTGDHGTGDDGTGDHGVSYLRPLLDIRRAQTLAACTALDLAPWDDPHNSDPAYARVRVRTRLLPALEAELGPGVAQALARTARQLRSDADALDELAAAAARRIADSEPGLRTDALAGLPAAVRGRVLRRAALAAGAPPGALGERHVAQLDALVTQWHGQQWVDLPGGVRGHRRYGRLLFAPVPDAAREAADGAARSEGLSGRE